ncbi:radical SAM peptide maturase [Parabacteroides distasonis]|uniref:radical SAM peptide maturase n=1 Tax=Parabacteroides distasonis TaxID=823 RepID=UPI00189FA807|nr:radical SAM peptide maturase [Parabacteroides distasonis]MDB9150911.1 radical SAM peptide maturase [Parabacteroides distasonis]MDB9155421.1 radical SAM peptide maturase [Parabacteroides distasonis]MDB9163783.1 radical SAM peptide maturase [Parabacteroides distasonis]MDB9167975.1 radical SAM peptide maturase [Parabacteroides distasonis]MDB9195543.1 radical SAM peptide maturase [Parabacteroides distasonis]
MNDKTFNTKNGNDYFYSDKRKSFHYISKGMKAFLDGKNDDDCDYYKRKYDFLCENGFFDKSNVDLTGMISKNDLEYNLSNLKLLLFEVTDMCNLSCYYCGYGSLYDNYDKRAGIKLSFDKAKKMIDYLYLYWKSEKNVSYNNVLSVGFYGGEPLLGFDVMKSIIDYIEDKCKDINFNFSYHITTNAILLDRYMDFLVLKNFNILVSLDGDKYSNSYRLNKNGDESFDQVMNNVLKLKELYPEYFESKVDFNAVLHNRNRVYSIYSFFKNNLNKIPRISELNTHGVSECKKEEFNTIFSNSTEEFRLSFYKKEISNETLSVNPEVLILNNFISSFCDNIYKDVKDLCFENQKYIPTGTCMPFQRKIFLTVNGKILPCERIGQEKYLGTIDEEAVNIDLDKIVNSYNRMYEKIKNLCNNCVLIKCCAYCMYFMDYEKKHTCDRFMNLERRYQYYSKMISELENNPILYSEIINNLIVD